MEELPTVQSVSSDRTEHRIDGEGLKTGKSITLDGSAVTDSGSTPATYIRPGNVVVKVTSSGKYVEANDATGDRNSVASVTGDADIGAGAASKTFKWKYAGGVEQTVTMGSADDTATKVAAALNADRDFAADLIADVPSANKLRIRSKRAGALEFFTITDGSLNDQGGVAEDTFDDDTDHQGSDADYRVTEAFADLLGSISGAAVDAPVANSWAGHYDESALINLTAEAKAVLSRRGSKFA